MRILMVPALVALMITPLAAYASTAQNGLSVASAGHGFAVQGTSGQGARAIWCAAGEYAFRTKGAGNADRLYISEGRKPGFGQRGPVTFTLDAGGLTPSAVLVTGLSLRNAGANLSVGHARSFCSNKSPSPGGTR